MKSQTMATRRTRRELDRLHHWRRIGRPVRAGDPIPKLTCVEHQPRFHWLTVRDALLITLCAAAALAASPVVGAFVLQFSRGGA